MARARTEADVRRAVRGAIAGGLAIARVEIDRDGKIVILAAGARDPDVEDLDRELAAFKATHGHGQA